MVLIGFLLPFSDRFCKNTSSENEAHSQKNMKATLQMFAGNYRDSTGKSECRDFKFMGIACIPAIPVTFKTRNLISIVIFEGNLILQVYHRDSLH